MFLKKARHKIQSSIATYHFAHLDLLWMKKHIPVHFFINNVLGTTVRNNKSYDNVVTGTRIASTRQHIEILRQAFKEYREEYTNNPSANQKIINYLDKIGWYLNDLRHAAQHTKEELILKFDAKSMFIKNYAKAIFKINVPVKTLDNGYEMFSEKSYEYKTLKFKVRPGKEVKLNHIFFNDLYHLSMHILTITKKLKPHTLATYLSRIPTTFKRKNK